MHEIDRALFHDVIVFSYSGMSSGGCGCNKKEGGFRPPRNPLQGAGTRAAGRPPYRRASEPPVRFGGFAAGPAARLAPCTIPLFYWGSIFQFGKKVRVPPGAKNRPLPRTSFPPPQGGGCVKGEPLRFPLCVQSVQRLSNLYGYAFPDFIRSNKKPNAAPDRNNRKEEVV